MPSNLDLADLYAFQALVKHGSFRAAAEALCLSQPALSRRIDKLENTLGVKLFERTTRRVNLTLIGRTFAPQAERLLTDFDEIISDISDTAGNRTGLVTVACVPSAAYYFMPKVIACFHSRYPRVRIKLIDTSAGNVYNAVLSGQADFGLSFTTAPQPEMAFLPLLQESYVAACRKDHPLAGKKSISWNEFYQHNYVRLDKTSGNRNLLDLALAKIDTPRPSVCETRHVTTLLGMVEAGLGIAAVPEMAMPGNNHPILTRILLTDPLVQREVGLLKRTGRLLSHSASELERLIIELHSEP